MDWLNKKTNTMYPSLSFVEEVTPTQNLCVLGFNGHFEDYLTQYFRYESANQLSTFENSFSAFQWLENTAENAPEELPTAIICDYSFLRDENFLFAENLKNNSILRTLPFLVICREHCFDGIESLSLGIDDVYHFPVNWDVLEQRIQFLQEYKPLYQSSMEVDEAIPQVKIPPAKRAFDILIALAAIIGLSPIWIAIAIAIKLESKGPIIYKSSRVGTGYQVFDFLKFRSMRQNADKEIQNMKHMSQYDNGKDGKGPLFLKFANDPRITRVGKLIRKTSLDEMPQLINVLKGEMSIVGNRPLPLYEAKELTQDAWAQRFLAPAGCTGLWQVSKRGKADMSTDERISLDIEYAEKYSFWFDMKILMKTFPALIQSENV